ncbi:BadF/BadG/BcrA/BcrD ATPase family protein [Sagittula sp. SSi028]|uniref:BadF/BadG/BcrA/BcrD ATPase family protein n=1 Tax=Sagittula sp. SSi028 TaxID=3400636 RepID=UPI003AF5BB69
MQIYIGVDGGGSGCRAAVGLGDAAPVGFGAAGPANVFSDFDGAIGNVRSAIGQAVAQAGVAPNASATARVHLGLAGVLDAAMAQRVAQALGGDPRVTDDRPTMLAGALGGGEGALAAIGTGSFVARRCGGDLRAVGGWGLVLSDEASGAWLGRALLAETLAAQDGMVGATALTRDTLAHFGTPSDVVAFAASAAPHAFAVFAPSVVAAAQAGDVTAVRLMTRGADWIEQALLATGADPAEPLCLTGGLGTAYVDYLTKPWHLADPIGTALDGALILAREQ